MTFFTSTVLTATEARTLPTSVRLGASSELLVSPDRALSPLHRCPRKAPSPPGLGASDIGMAGQPGECVVDIFSVVLAEMSLLNTRSGQGFLRRLPPPLSDFACLARIGWIS